MRNPYQTPETKPKTDEKDCDCIFRSNTPAWLEWLAVVMLLVMTWFAGIGIQTVMIHYGFEFPRGVLNEWFEKLF